VLCKIAQKLTVFEFLNFNGFLKFENFALRTYFENKMTVKISKF